jgi:hypothetical protein
MASIAPNIGSGSSPRAREVWYALVNLEVTVSAKKRALGSSSASGAISVMNSRRTADSAIFWEAGEGASGATSGPP